MAKRLIMASVLQDTQFKRVSTLKLELALYDLHPGDEHLMPKFKDLPEDVQTAFKEWINDGSI